MQTNVYILKQKLYCIVYTIGVCFHSNMTCDPLTLFGTYSLQPCHSEINKEITWQAHETWLSLFRILSSSTALNKTQHIIHPQAKPHSQLYPQPRPQAKPHPQTLLSTWCNTYWAWSYYWPILVRHHMYVCVCVCVLYGKHTIIHRPYGAKISLLDEL